MLVDKLVVDVDVEKQGCPVQIACGTRLFMLASLLQVHAIAGAVEGDFALLATTLRTDSSVDRGAEALFFADFADRATQRDFSELLLSHVERGWKAPSHGPNIAILELGDVKNLSSCTFSYTSSGKTA